MDPRRFTRGTIVGETRKEMENRIESEAEGEGDAIGRVCAFGTRTGKMCHKDHQRIARAEAIQEGKVLRRVAREAR